MYTFVIAKCSRIYAATVCSQHLSTHSVIPVTWVYALALADINGPRPTSMGVYLGNGITRPVGTSGEACLHLCHFLEFLLSIHSTDSESNSDSHSCHSHDTGEALCFPKDLTSVVIHCPNAYTVMLKKPNRNRELRRLATAGQCIYV